MVDSHDNDQTANARPLAVLRAMIDAVDHDLLQQLSRRNALVAEIAAHKRAHGLQIRDHARERSLLDDRRERAGSLGLSPDMIESLFLLILWASRDRQAALRAEVPLNVEPRTVAIIGGNGGMGRCLSKMFGDLGHAVMIADIDTPLRPEEAAKVADVVAISVPIDATVAVIEEFGPLVREDALLMDVTSIKEQPLAAMLRVAKSSVIGTHPLFGPSVHSLQGQRIVLTHGRGDEWLNWLKGVLHARGLAMLETDAEQHDRVMAIVQVLTHFSTEVLGRTLANLDVSMEETLTFTSPIYLLELLMTARHFAQSPELYASIQMSNPRTGEVTASFAKAASDLHEMAATGDRAGFAAMFKDVRTFFGPFTEQALAQSDFLIDRLVERA